VKRNGESVATINALGMRGDMPVTPKPAGTPRVLVLGDSTFFGHGVNDADTFPAQLQRVLGERGHPVEVLNAAVPGYSSEQSRVQLEELGWSLEPDLLIIGSLWSDNNIDSFQDQDLLRTVHAYANNPLYDSAFFRLLAGAVDRARGGTGAHLVTWTKSSQWSSKGGRRVSLARYAENLDTMADEAAARGVGVAFIAPCNIGLVNGEYPDGASWDPYFAVQEQIAAFHHVPWIRTLPAMQAAAGGDPKALFVDVMHPSRAGHAVFATLTADTLLAAGWPEQKLLATPGTFPTDGLVDNSFSNGPANPQSPQRNLFPGTPPATPDPMAPGHDPYTPLPVDDGAAPAADAGPVQHHVNTPPPAGPVSADNGDPTQKWAVDGTVTGGSAPIRVEVHGPTGQLVGNVSLQAAGPFTLHIRGDVDAIEVVATDTTGARASANTTRARPTVSLAF
jgi:lysophospholipase L1-like esterase